VLAGERVALEQLVGRHHGWIYNLAVRMTGDPHEAEDVAQEALLVVLTRLSGFEGRSSFRTWLRRVVCNHVLNTRKRRREQLFAGFDAYGDAIRGAPDQEPPDPRSLPVDAGLLLEEVKVSCMMGMLLCLSREQRLTFVLGEVFGVGERVGSELLEISPEAWRQRLSRARRAVHGFMRTTCGLVDEANPCHCSRKARGMVASGEIDPARLAYAGRGSRAVAALCEERVSRLGALHEELCAELFRGHPLLDPPAVEDTLRTLMARPDFREVLEL
jgi:RNA polymerase sigma factor (sigma-70 family)